MTPRLLDMTPEALEAAAADAGEPAYRARQLADWVFRKGVTDPAGMTNLPRRFAERFAVLTSRRLRRADSRDGTVKLLLGYADRERVECVRIPERRRATACVSAQAGCGMGCAFCASADGGLGRSLTAGEILEQLLHLRQAAGGVTHVVFMGSGEPLANYDATVAAVRAIVDPRRFGLSARRVTVSTVGLPEAMRRLAGERLPVTLALSLHAPHDALRRRLLPAAAGAPLEEVLAAAEAFYASRKREVTIEYVLLAGVNDTPACAEALARIARRLRCNVNLIRYNPVAGKPFAPPSQQAARGFARRLRRRGVNAHLRRARGADAEAACGQLRRRAAGEAENLFVGNGGDVLQ
jgi:23S rRNA (adenine2503-C2)-methyltransferase